jgi:hypothetical protein
MIGQDILLEIDSTLDQLICNAEMMQNVDLTDLSETEIEAFKKTQDSLIQHLIHMDESLTTKRKNLSVQDKRSASYKIQQKRSRFETLKTSYQQDLSKVETKVSILSKRRNKRFLAVH